MKVCLQPRNARDKQVLDVVTSGDMSKLLDHWQIVPACFNERSLVKSSPTKWCKSGRNSGIDSSEGTTSALSESGRIRKFNPIESVLRSHSPSQVRVTHAGRPATGRASLGTGRSTSQCPRAGAGPRISSYQLRFALREIGGSSGTRLEAALVQDLTLHRDRRRPFQKPGRGG